MHTPRLKPYRAITAVLVAACGLAANAADPANVGPGGTIYERHYAASDQPGKLTVDVDYRLWIPAGAKRLRGVIVHQHGCGTGAEQGGLTAADDLHWQSLAKKWDCALLGPSYHAGDGRNCRLWCDPRNGSGETFLTALSDFAKETGHPEIAEVPWCLWGHSGGGFWASLIQVAHPERIVAIWLRSGTAFATWEKGEVPKPEIPSAAYEVPVMGNPGAKERDDERFHGAWDGLIAMHAAYRAKDAPFGFAPDPRMSHECGDSRYLAIPFFDACLAARLPEPGGSDQRLRPIDRSRAWLAEVGGSDPVAASAFKGDPLKAVWLPDEAFATKWSEYVKTGAVGDTTPPAAPTDVATTRTGEGVELKWTAVADFESGLKAFVIERDGHRIGQLPKEPVGRFGRPLFQTMSYHDTPERPLPEMKFLDAVTPGEAHAYRVIAVNSAGAESAPSEPAKTETASAPTWKAGAATVVITPDAPMWMAGYAARDKPAQGKLQDLNAKALALEDPNGRRAVLVTMDLVGIPRDVSVAACDGIMRKHGLPREAVLLAVSHTHSGPVVGSNLHPAHPVDGKNQKLIDEYTKLLTGKLVEVAGAALAHLDPADLSRGNGYSTFAVNRRNNGEGNVPALRAAGRLAGPVDHDLPVLAVRAKDGTLKAILFGYACHATVLEGYDWSGDYPGFAQSAFEQAHPGATALFFAGCGADQNPIPRRAVPLAETYGRQLAQDVDEVLAAPMTPVTGDFAAAYAEVPLPFAALPTREQLEQAAAGANRYEAGRAKLLLKQLDEKGTLAPAYPYPVQAWRLGDLTFVALGGEVVVDYALRLKRELGPGTTWVAGYANDVMAYIPSLRVLNEGGYEGGGAMVYYGLPSAWTPQVEEIVVSAAREQVAKVRGEKVTGGSSR